MDQGIEQQIPIEIIVAVFVTLCVISSAIRRILRRRHLVREGQVFTKQGEPLPISVRVSANREWSSGEIRSKGHLAVGILWLVTAVWFLTFGVSFFKSFSRTDMPLGGRIVLGIFSALGFVPLYFAARFTKRQMKFGTSVCLIDGKAGVIGKEIKGRVRTNVSVRPKGNYVFTVQCLEHYHTGTGSNRKSHTSVHWQGTQNVSANGVSSERGIPFEITIPEYPPETGDPISRGQLNWQLRVKTDDPEVDYDAMFIVPVFKTG